MQELEEEQSVAKANEVVLAEMIFPNRFVEVVDKDGNAVAWSANLTGHVLTIPANTMTTARQQTIGFAAVNHLRVAVVPLSPNNELGYAAVAEPLSVIEIGLHR